jgi:NADPH:quinone reductase-like Zn-dependent oxidoreductase
MKAAVIYENGGPDVLRYEDVPDPECPDGHVVVDVEAISIEGGDLLHRAGAELPSVRTSSGTSRRARSPTSVPASRTARSATASSP